MDFFEDKWFPIFKTGMHTDSEGHEKTWTGDDLDIIASSYNAKEHEAPLTIGHPKTDAPAYGWVNGVKREGEVLYAKAEKLVPEFVDMVKRGMFKKRSISIYPDLTLKHIGFLGADAPAVKGLEDIKFSEGKKTTIEFAEFACDSFKQVIIARVILKLRDYLIETIGKEKAELIISQFDVEELLRVEVEVPVAAAATETFSEGKDMSGPGTNIKATPVSFTEAQMQAKINEAMKAKETEYAEAALGKDRQYEEKVAALKVQEAKVGKAEVKAFCESLKGKITPAMMKDGLQEFLEGLLGREIVVEFGEGTGTKKVTEYEYMKNFLSNLPSQIKFGEVANDKNDIGNAGEDKKTAIIKEYQEKNKVAYYEAGIQAAKDNPALFTVG